jgi:hypothetical protein
MALVLKPHEVRVLGVLIEKSMALPQYYPMTLSAITAGCNQKNNRDPVLSLTEGEVGTALHELTQWQLVSQAPPEPGARANRFRHEVEKRLGWSSPQRAIMAELMLRGPQTLGELRTNASRMMRIDATDYVREVLGELERMDPPWVVELARQPGRRETRFAQLLGGPVCAPAPQASSALAPAPEPTADWTERLLRLETEIATLRGELAELRRQVQSPRPF